MQKRRQELVGVGQRFAVTVKFLQPCSNRRRWFGYVALRSSRITVYHEQEPPYHYISSQTSSNTGSHAWYESE